MCLLIPIMKSPIKSNRRISLSRDAPFSWLCSVCSTSVSIHAPRVGCDQDSSTGKNGTLSFNPRTPGGVRPHCARVSWPEKKFQSTHPGWGATERMHDKLEYELFQSTHPGRGATLDLYAALSFLSVSIHAPRAGCDSQTITTCCKNKKTFQSTHPGWGATTAPVRT